MNKYILICVMTIALLGGCAESSEAGSYEIVKGKGVEVCEAYKENLDSFKPKKSMMCLRNINFKYKDFSKPDFKTFLPRPKGVMRKIDLFLWKRDANPAYYVLTNKKDEWTGSKKQIKLAWENYLKDRNGRLNIGHKIAYIDIDIDNDGKKDNVYLDRACNAYGSILMVLNKNKTDIDYAITKLVMQHPSRNKNGWPVYIGVKKGDMDAPYFIRRGYKPTPDSLHSIFYDVFRYKEKTYFDQIWSDGFKIKNKVQIEKKILRVFSIKKQATNEICTIKYKY